MLKERERFYVLAVTSSQQLRFATGSATVKEVVTCLPRASWQRLSAGDGTKGPRFYDWALFPFRSGSRLGWQNAVLFRRSTSDKTNIAYYFVFAPPEATLATRARVAGSRWGIEESFETAKGKWDSTSTRCVHGRAGIVTSR